MPRINATCAPFPLSMHAGLLHWVFAMMLTLGLAGAPAFAAGPTADEKAQTVVHMLDYVGVDYPGTVEGGKIKDEAEYQEQQEFVTQVIALLQQLTPAAETPAVLARAQTLLARIGAKAPGDEVSGLANTLRADVIRVYRIAVAPRQAPDLRRATALFQANCIACHGAQGRGDGPLAKGMEPAPSNFHEEERMQQRSIYGLYNTIALGVGGTPMRAFTEFSDDDRWALAFFVSAMRSEAKTVAAGETLWKEGKGKAEFSNLRALVTQTPAELQARGADIDTVRTYLTAHPEAVRAAGPAPLALSRAKLDEALQAYRKGDRETARQAAITAYLEGFELVEASLDNVDAPLRASVEREMMALRSTISEGKPADVLAEQIASVGKLLDAADDKLSSGSLSPTAAFISSLLILLREGLEAILVLAAISAFVIKTGRRDALPYIHAGWMGAVVAGAATWAVAQYLLAISGANREVTEGVAALLAAAMLLYVGYWLHSKSNAQAWNSFIKGQVTAALARRTLWAMAGISFLAVYRELFEIILFYETLFEQVGAEGRNAVYGGIAAAAVLLFLVGGAILKYSVRLPIGPFFTVTSALLAIMAVVFVGNGIAALQEAGVIDATAVRFFSLPLLGIHPTAQGLWMQAAALALVVAGLVLGKRSAKVA